MAAEDGLELLRWGTRFADAKTERAYRVWDTGRGIPFTRVGMVGSVLAWVLTSFTVPLSAPTRIAEGLAAIWLGPMPLIVAALVMTSVPRWHRWLLPATSLANAAAGFCGLWLCNIAGIADLGVAAVCVVAFFGFGVFRMPPAWATGSVATYALADGLWATSTWRAGHASTTLFVFEVVILLVTMQSGVLISVAINRESRLAYRQEKTIEAQSQTIATERARSEGLLKQELSHQVAARSRDLGRMLAKVEATLVPGRPKVGERFDTRYRVERELGAGAMGAVYEVERVTDGQRLALKVVTGEVSPDRAARFAREAEIGARVRHDNVISIVDVGVADGGVPFLAMELAPRGSLEERRERFGDAPWASTVLAAVARGLAALHEAGVVHRDLKPANVLLVGDDEAALVAKISDFGISRFGELDATPEVDPTAATLGATPLVPHALTATGMLLGTPYYMAPEAARGTKVDSPADVFAFGILACEMLTGRPPFATPPMLGAMAGEPLRAPTGLDDVRVPRAIAEILRACLLEDPSARPSMRRVRDAFAV